MASAAGHIMCDGAVRCAARDTRREGMVVGGTGKKELVTTEFDPAAGVQKIEGVRRHCYACVFTPKPRRHLLHGGFDIMQMEQRALTQ